MLTPDYKTFLQLSRDATLIPVAKTLSADLLTPVGAFLSLAARQKYAFLLESVEGGEKIGRYTFLGAQPRMVITARGKDLSPFGDGSSVERHQGSVIELLRTSLRQYRPATLPDLPPFTSGCVGYFAYDMVRQFERLPERAKDDVGLPDCVFTFYDRLLAFDHLRHQVHIIAAADVRSESPRKAYDRALADIAAIEAKLARGVRGAAPSLVRRRQEEADQGPQQHVARQVRRQRSPGKGIHRRRRRLPGRAFAAAGLQAAGRAVPDLSRLANGESVALHVLSEARRHARGGRVAGDAGARLGTKAGIPAHRGHPQTRRRSGRRRAPDRGSCATTRKSAPST